MWAINAALAFVTFKPDAADGLWETAIRDMPLSRWMYYPSLVIGSTRHIRKLRTQSQDGGDLQSLLAAAPLAERAYAALTHRSIKGSHLETSREAVGLLIEIANLQHAAATDSFISLDIPEATKLMELSVVNAAANRKEVDLFAKALTFLAQHYSTCGDREKAKDTSIQALSECAQLPKQEPEMVRLLLAIFEANKD
jgi:hypothetical protein